MKKSIAAAPLLGVVLLSGCTFGPKQSTAPASTTSTSSSSSSAPQTSSAAPETSSSSSSASSSSSSSSSSNDSGDGSTFTKKPFGSSAKWPDGVEVSVSQPKPFTPGEYASTDGDFKKFVVVEITVKNGSNKPIKPYDVRTSATSGDTETKMVYDFEQNIGSSGGSALPGKSIKWKEAYGVNDKGELTVALEKDYNDETIYFEG